MPAHRLPINTAVEAQQIITTRQLPALGICERSFYQRLTSGSLHRLWPGAGMDSEHWNGLSDRDRKIAEILAFEKVSSDGGRRAPEPVFSHDSALLLHGLRLVDLPEKIHIGGVPRPHRNSPQVSGHLDVFGWDPLPMEQLGLLVQPGLIAMLQSLLKLPFAEGLVIADQGMARGVEREAAIETLLASPVTRHRARALRVMMEANALSESVLESQTRAEMILEEVPPPQLQLEVTTPSGRKRLDLAWEEEKVALEVDGKVKYSGETLIRQVLYLERKRENELIEDGWRVLRTEAFQILHRRGITAGKVLRALRERSCGRKTIPLSD